MNFFIDKEEFLKKWSSPCVCCGSFKKIRYIEKKVDNEYFDTITLPYCERHYIIELRKMKLEKLNG